MDTIRGHVAGLGGAKGRIHSVDRCREHQPGLDSCWYWQRLLPGEKSVVRSLPVTGGFIARACLREIWKMRLAVPRTFGIFRWSNGSLACNCLVLRRDCVVR